ncbi:MAG: aldo/keto reductase [Elusimicrobiota bacterium]
MNKRVFGRTNWNISEIGYGGWGIGRNWWGSTDDQESSKSLNLAWDKGINFFDTAYVYGDGHSEELMGQVLKGKAAIIATKIPPKNDEWPGNPKTPLKEVFPADWIKSCTERSLKKLKRDYLDLTQLHVWSDAWLNQDEWKTTVEQLKKSGKIKAFGVSINDHDPDSALQLVSSGLIDSVQVIFNIFDQSPTKNLFPLCEKHKVAVIVRVPFDEGGLTGTLNLETKFEKGDFRAQYFQGDHLKQTVERVEKLKEFLNPDTPLMTDLALKFILAHKAVSAVIPGMRKSQHVEKNVAVSSQKLLLDKTLEQLKNHAWQRNFYGWWN